MNPRIYAASAAVLLGTACSNAPDPAQPKIGNGIEVTTETDDTRAVVMLKQRVADGNYRGFCSGTLLNDTTLLTAVHCLLDKQTGGMYLDTGGRHVASKRAFYSERAANILAQIDTIDARLEAIRHRVTLSEITCDAALGLREVAELGLAKAKLLGELPRHDVALVVFPAGTGQAITRGHGYYGVGTSAPRTGAQAMLLGYGQSKAGYVQLPDACGKTLRGEGFGVKRLGYGELSEVTDGTIQTYGYRDRESAAQAGVEAGKEATIRPGDSGGPWVACDGENCSTHRVLAVSSTGTFNSDELETNTGARADTAEAQQTYARAIGCGSSGDCAANFVGSGVD